MVGSSSLHRRRAALGPDLAVAAVRGARGRCVAGLDVPHHGFRPHRRPLAPGLPRPRAGRRAAAAHLRDARPRVAPRLRGARARAGRGAENPLHAGLHAFRQALRPQQRGQVPPFPDPAVVGRGRGVAGHRHLRLQGPHAAAAGAAGPGPGEPQGRLGDRPLRRALPEPWCLHGAGQRPVVAVDARIHQVAAVVPLWPRPERLGRLPGPLHRGATASR
mmetsp:Transcript_105784/g.341258  ORF Transcript_105784/g.341258 Transcript_105784/m.341258 type:complete len:218 (+) Transcript_105784:1024-1677(+)